jgi:hypothetical protein
MHGPPDGSSKQGRRCLVGDGSAVSVLLPFATVARGTDSQLVQDES